MVRGNVYGYQRAGAAVLQPAVCGIRAIQPTGGTTRTAEAQRGQSGGVEGATGTGGACQPIQKTWEADMAGMRDDEYVHGTGWADGHRRYHLKLDPFDGSVYVFRNGTGSMLKYIEWDGQGFLQGKRRAQSGRYPWPKGQTGDVLEISEKEFEYLLSRLIVPFKTQKGL